MILFGYLEFRQTFTFLCCLRPDSEPEWAAAFVAQNQDRNLQNLNLVFAMVFIVAGLLSCNYDCSSHRNSYAPCRQAIADHAHYLSHYYLVLTIVVTLLSPTASLAVANLVSLWDHYFTDSELWSLDYLAFLLVYLWNLPQYWWRERRLKNWNWEQYLA